MDAPNGAMVHFFPVGNVITVTFYKGAPDLSPRRMGAMAVVAKVSRRVGDRTLQHG